jgi:PilZ domain
MPGTITDISIGGCYVEMLSPLPVKTLIKLPINLGEETLLLSGEVRSAQAGFGMGVLFVDVSAENLEKLQRFAPSGAIDAPVAPPVQAPPAPQAARPPEQQASAPATESLSAPTQGEALGVLMRILLRKGLVTQEELQEELDKLKSPRS